MLPIALFFAATSAMPQLAARTEDPSQFPFEGPSRYSSDLPAPYNDWRPAYVDEFRGPCPMLNTLSNHGFLPHDGGKKTPLTFDVVKKGLSAISFDPSLVEIMFEQALKANPTPNATFFNLDMLNVHNVLEHDASLSRSDAYFGNNHVFNQSVFDEAKKYWTTPIIDRYQMANAQVARRLQSKAGNPEWHFTEDINNFSVGEIIAPFIALGDRDAVTVRRDFTVYLFEHERLPVELGWSPQTEPIALDSIVKLLGELMAATELFSEPPSTNASSASTHQRRGFHGVPF